MQRGLAQPHVRVNHSRVAHDRKHRQVTHAVRVRVRVAEADAFAFRKDAHPRILRRLKEEMRHWFTPGIEYFDLRVRWRTHHSCPGLNDDLLSLFYFEPVQVRIGCARVPRHMETAVNRCRYRERLCLFLRAEGLPYRDIAKALDVSLGAVAKSLARTMTRLANVFED